jgi:hypothetical protein
VFAWGEAIVARETSLKASHINELRTAVNEVYIEIGVTPPTYTDPALGPGVIFKMEHVSELRSAITSLE